MFKLFIGYTLLGIWVLGILALVLFFILKFRMYKKLAEIENKNHKQYPTTRSERAFRYFLEVGPLDWRTGTTTAVLETSSQGNITQHTEDSR